MTWKRFVGAYQKLHWIDRFGVWAGLASIGSFVLFFAPSPHESQVPPPPPQPSISITVPVTNSLPVVPFIESGTSGSGSSLRRATISKRAEQPRVPVSSAAIGSAAHLRFDEALVQKIRDANSYAAGGNTSGEAEALRLYREVVRELSPATTKQLNQRLLNEAERDFAASDVENAVRKYQALFADVVASAVRPW